MNLPLIEQQDFKNKNFTTTLLEKAEYDDCTFLNCDFSNTNLSNVIFIDCTFKTCNFSNTILNQTSFRAVHFEDSKLIGVPFNMCNNFLLAFNFTNCTLNFSSFYNLKIKNSTFNNCNLLEVDFTETDATQSIFENCNFKHAQFNRSILEKVDFRGSKNFIIHPGDNKITKAKFLKEDLIGLLQYYNIIIE